MVINLGSKNSNKIDCTFWFGGGFFFVFFDFFDV